MSEKSDLKAYERAKPSELCDSKLSKWLTVGFYSGIGTIFGRMV